jgi:hypothetical protein
MADEKNKKAKKTRRAGQIIERAEEGGNAVVTNAHTNGH